MRYQRDGYSVEAAIRKGRSLPAWYLLWTEPLPGDDWFMGAFWDLSTERPIGMGSGPIPWSALLRYAAYAGLTPGTMLLFRTVIHAMDREYLKWQEAQQESKMKTARTKK